MRKFLLLLAFLFLISCGDYGAERIVSVSDETSRNGNGQNNSENQEVSDESMIDDGNGGTGEKSDGGEYVADDENPEISDDCEYTKDDSDIHGGDEIPDGGENHEPTDGDSPVNDENLFPDDDETPDEEPPVCGELFNGSNCFRASCWSDADCCEADLCVATDACGGAKVCRNAFFKENFDSYVAGSFPNGGPWTLKYDGVGKKYQIVTSEKYVSEQNSMHLLGRSDWSAIMTTVLPQVPTVINVEVKMNTEGNDVYLALCTFNGSGKWGNYDMKIEFADGKIRYQIPEWFAYDVTASYEPDVWYKIRFKLDQANKTVSVWVNDELKVDSQVHDFDSLLIPNLCLSSNKGQKKVWFDDIFVWAE